MRIIRWLSMVVCGVMAAQASEVNLAAGKATYDRYCGGCHGAKGDGQGPAAIFLDPKPRDFTSGKFKFASVPSGDLPTDADLQKTIIHGLSGSSMPAWPLLPERERVAVIAYLKTFSPKWKTESPGTPIIVPADPYKDDPREIAKAIAQGEFVYHAVTTCWQCHPGYVTPAKMEEFYTKRNRKFAGVRADFEKPVVKEDGWKQPLKPTDFLHDRIRTGLGMESLFVVIGAGIGGTAMPTWKDSIPDEDLWALAYYVRSLADRRNDKVRNLPLSAPPDQTKVKYDNVAAGAKQ